MPNRNQLIITAAQFTGMLIIQGGGSYKLDTIESLSMSETSEGETIYAVGEEDPIGEQSNANKYSGKIGLQVGEMNAIMLIEGIRSAIRIRNATFSIAALKGGFTRTFLGCNFNTATVDIKRKDKESLYSIDFNAVGIL